MVTANLIFRTTYFLYVMMLQQLQIYLYYYQRMGILLFTLKMCLNCDKSGSRFKLVRMVLLDRRVVTCCLKNAEIKRIGKLVK